MSLDLSAISETFSSSITSFTLDKLLSSLLILVICLIAIKVITTILARLLNHPRFEARVQKYILTAAKILLNIMTILIVADSLGIPVTSLLALFSVFGLAISLAVQDVLANVAGGLVILFSKPFQLGDYIETDTGAGTVASINLTYTQLDTPNGQRLMIPNSIMADGKITNYTQLGTRRIDHTITASYDDAIPAVRAACLKAVDATPNILPDPAPVVVVTNYGESAIEYHVRCWTKVDNYWDAHFALLENIKTAFDQNGITMTYNHLNVHIVEK